MRRKHCRVPKGRPDGFPCSSPESSATSADLDRRIDGKLQVEDKASRFKSYHAADKCYERWRALRTSPDGRAELLEFFVFSVCYECYAHSLRALLAVRTPPFRFRAASARRPVARMHPRPRRHLAPLRSTTPRRLPRRRRHRRRKSAPSARGRRAPPASRACADGRCTTR